MKILIIIISLFSCTNKHLKLNIPKNNTILPKLKLNLIKSDYDIIENNEKKNKYITLLLNTLNIERQYNNKEKQIINK